MALIPNPAYTSAAIAEADRLDAIAQRERYEAAEKAWFAKHPATLDGSYAQFGWSGSPPPRDRSRIVPRPLQYIESGSPAAVGEGTAAAPYTNRFLKGIDRVTLGKAAEQDSWDSLAAMLLNSGETAQGRVYNSTIRDRLMGSGQQIRGLSHLRALVGEATPEQQAMDLGNYFESSVDSKTPTYQWGTGQGRDLLTRAVAAKTGDQLGDDGDQVAALRAALTHDLAPTLRGSIGRRINDSYLRYKGGSTLDPQFSGSTSYLDFAKRIGLY